MEGRAIARPNSVRITLSPTDGPELQWRAEQLLGQTEGMGGVAPAFVTLQWRAEQLLGQTRRTWRLDCGNVLSCFNGGPSNCSAKPLRAAVVGAAGRASMEGRAIARPNSTGTSRAHPMTGLLQWRAEQLLGQTRWWLGWWWCCSWLQWRAEQLLGQTSSSRRGLSPDIGLNGGPSNCSAKPAQPPSSPHSPSSFNGGPSNCSAKPGAQSTPPVEHQRFNGGPSNCSAKPPTPWPAAG